MTAAHEEHGRTRGRGAGARAATGSGSGSGGGESSGAGDCDCVCAGAHASVLAGSIDSGAGAAVELRWSAAAAAATDSVLALEGGRAAPWLTEGEAEGGATTGAGAVKLRDKLSEEKGKSAAEMRPRLRCRTS